jgi:hypothetical protein
LQEFAYRVNAFRSWGEHISSQGCRQEANDAEDRLGPARAAPPYSTRW